MGDLQSGQVRPGPGLEADARGYIGHRPEYLLCWVVIAAALAIAAIVAGVAQTASGGRGELGRESQEGRLSPFCTSGVFSGQGRYATERGSRPPLSGSSGPPQ